MRERKLIIDLKNRTVKGYCTAKQFKEQMRELREELGKYEL